MSAPKRVSAAPHARASAGKAQVGFSELSTSTNVRPKAAEVTSMASPGGGAQRLSVPRTASVSWYMTSFQGVFRSLPDATVRLRRARPSGRSGPGYS